MLVRHMNTRIVLAAVVAGIALFVWESVAHMATPLGTAGFRELPNEAAVAQGLKTAIGGGGLFYFPAPKPGQPMTPPAGMPTGLLLFHGNGRGMITAQQLGFQLAIDILSMLLAGMILARMPGLGFGRKLLVALTIAVFPTLRSEGPMWIWYGFPKRYVAAQFAMNLIGFALAGGLLIAIADRRAAKAKTAAA